MWHSSNGIPRKAFAYLKVYTVRALFSFLDMLYWPPSRTFIGMSATGFICNKVIAWLILGLRPTNERRCYFITTSLIGREPRISPVIVWFTIQFRKVIVDALLNLSAAYNSPWPQLKLTSVVKRKLCLYSLNGRTSYRKISWSPEATRFGFRLSQSLWGLTSISAAALPWCL